MSKQFAIADVHGCLNTFEALLDKIGFSQSDELYMLGDYIDRGWNSKGVIDKIQTLQTQGYTIKCQRGNHEEMFLEARQAELSKELPAYLCNRFLKSFGASAAKDVPEKYAEFCAQLPYYQLVGKYILVHAGLNFEYGDPFDEVDKSELIWVRDWYKQLNKEWLGDRFVLHGHTPQTKMETTAQLRYLPRNRVLDLDCGAFMNKQKPRGYGYLAAFDMTNQELYFQENVDKDNTY